MSPVVRAQGAILAVGLILVLAAISASSSAVAHDCTRSDCPPPLPTTSSCTIPALVLCSTTTTTSTTSSTNGTVVINVNSTDDSQKHKLPGQEAELWTYAGPHWWTGTFLTSCFTPCSFRVPSGQSFWVAMADYQNFIFHKWTTGRMDRAISVTTGTTIIDLTAVYYTG